ncbi:MAG TPA: hypothetical protein VK169_02495 [Saprospiraceae bacterium]|nr:hypothetical protein [Saprospiraceae bacterium]
MNVKEVKNKEKLKTNTSKTIFPQVKIDGFHDAIKNTDMLKVVEQIKREKIKKP